MTKQYRKDYTPPHYELQTTDLDFHLDSTCTKVHAKLCFKNVCFMKPIVLNGQYMQLKSIKIDGIELNNTQYEVDDKTLTLHPDKESFVLETSVEINPSANTHLAGLYMSNGLFCTQCEPQGFRNITYYPDHSDVPSKFRVSIYANRKKYPVLLSNGNCILDANDKVVYEDPFNKPCYLFALVAGDLDNISDSFITKSGKKVDLHLYCERGKKNRLTFAMQALKRAMAWDEKVYGLEYDLDVFNIVAVPHFNSGAMENKSLNIFNDAALLASPNTATDASYEYIEHVIAHEYFHNYSGDRVTLKSWFELSLKEGFTVFRDSSYGYDTFSRAVSRIDDVAHLRAYQFAEDDGPLSHPVRPDSYYEIENFYTTTIYDKGAEVIRMQEALVGHTAFMQGCDLYFKKYDGQAVDIDAFVGAIEEASSHDLTQFKLWYSQAGRPVVSVYPSFNKEKGVYEVLFKQSHPKCKHPFIIPLHYGLIAQNGKELKKGTFVLSKKSQVFTFKNLKQKPVLSINRFFTSPITLKIAYTKTERLILMQHDTDLFNRYEVGHKYVLNSMVKMIEKDRPTLDKAALKALGLYFTQKKLDKAFIARAIALPGMSEMFDALKVANIQKIKTLRHEMCTFFATHFEKELLQSFKQSQEKGEYIFNATQVANRALKNVCLGYLSYIGYDNLVYKAYQTANNLTDRIAALSILINRNLKNADVALNDFYEMYKDDDIVLNKWFALQAGNTSQNTLSTVEKLLSHDKFDYKNPNKVRALLGAFAGNLESFHNKEGYNFYAAQCAKIDAINPHLAARLLTAFAKSVKLDVKTTIAAQKALKHLASMETLSSLSRETVERMIIK